MSIIYRQASLHGGVCHRRMWMEVIMRNLLIGIQTGHNHNYPDISHKERIRYVYVLRIVSNNYRLIAELICLLSHLYLWCGVRGLFLTESNMSGEESDEDKYIRSKATVAHIHFILLTSS